MCVHLMEKNLVVARRIHLPFALVVGYIDLKVCHDILQYFCTNYINDKMKVVPFNNIFLATIP